MIRFKCTGCGTVLQAPGQYAGKRVKCSKCERVLDVPRESALPDDERVLCICPGCKANFKADDTDEGKKLKCPQCSSAFDLPGAGEVSGDASTLRFRCGGCGQKYRVPSRYAGKKFRCLACKQPCAVPELPELPQEAMEADEFIDESPPVWDDDPADEERQEQEHGREAQVDAGSEEKPGGFMMMNNGRMIKRRIGSQETDQPDKPMMIPAAVVIGFYVVAGLGFLLFIGGEPEDRTREAINYSRSLIIQFNRGKFNPPKTMADFMDFVDNGPSTEGIEVLWTLAGDIATITPEVLHTHANHRICGFVIRNTVEFKNAPAREVLMGVYLVRDYQGFVEVIVNDADGNKLGSAGEIDAGSLEAEIDKFVDDRDMPRDGFFFYGLAVGLIVVLMFFGSVWKVLEMADEGGWASMLPIYNMVALARAGGKPGILGAVCVVVNLVPVAGTLVSLGLYVYISIGLARRFDQGVLFGLGLAYLPYVFYPLLALSDRGFD